METPSIGGGNGIRSRSQFPEPFAARVLNAAPSDVLGFFPCDAGFKVLQVEALALTDLKNENIKAAVRKHLVDEWVEQFIKDRVRIAP